MHGSVVCRHPQYGDIPWRQCLYGLQPSYLNTPSRCRDHDWRGHLPGLQCSCLGLFWSFGNHHRQCCLRRLQQPYHPPYPRCGDPLGQLGVLQLHQSRQPLSRNLSSVCYAEHLLRHQQCALYPLQRPQRQLQLLFWWHLPFLPASRRAHPVGHWRRCADRSAVCLCRRNHARLAICRKQCYVHPCQCLQWRSQPAHPPLQHQPFHRCHIPCRCFRPLCIPHTAHSGQQCAAYSQCCLLWQDRLATSCFQHIPRHHGRLRLLWLHLAARSAPTADHAYIRWLVRLPRVCQYWWPPPVTHRLAVRRHVGIRRLFQNRWRTDHPCQCPLSRQWCFLQLRQPSVADRGQ